MYIALYDRDLKHIDNVDHVTYDLTTRVYDPDSFSAEGVCDSNVNDAFIAVLNDDQGNYCYACFVDSIKPEKKKRTIKGLDFKTLWDTDILLDFTEAKSFDGYLRMIVYEVEKAVFGDWPYTIGNINVKVLMGLMGENTAHIFGSYQGTYKIVNAYSFLKCYLKYYELNIESKYDVSTNTITFSFVKCEKSVSVDLNDFLYELTTTSSEVNRTVATLQYDTKTPETDDEGNILYSDVQETDENGDPKVDEKGNPVYIPIYKPRPSDLATKYYYRDRENNVVEGDADGNHTDGTPIEGRLYPVRTKIFEAEYLRDAQYDAVNELANARYVDNIVIDHNAVRDPIDFSGYPLYTKVNLYYEGKLYKTLPISEKITKLDASGESIKIKLGFKKILLTEIIKK